MSGITKILRIFIIEATNLRFLFLLQVGGNKEKKKKWIQRVKVIILLVCLTKTLSFRVERFKIGFRKRIQYAKMAITRDQEAIQNIEALYLKFQELMYYSFVTWHHIKLITTSEVFQPAIYWRRILVEQKCLRSSFIKCSHLHWTGASGTWESNMLLT